MDICCIEECGANSVRPMLVAPRCDVEPVAYYPCLPACTKTVYCCEKPKPKHHHQEHRSESYHGHGHGLQDSHRSDSYHGHGHSSHHKIERRPCSPPNNHQDCCYIRPPSPHPSCCEPQCKPVKTKYIIPCYRYEDGRIANQPTVLMRRACEVAVGNRSRKKPYVETRFIQDADHKESRYIREDEEKNHSRSLPVGHCAPCPQYSMEYPPCMTGRPSPQLPRDCYYCNPC